MKPGLSSLRALSIASLLVVGGSLMAQQVPAEPERVAAQPNLVILELAPRGDDLAPSQRDAVQKGILAMAREADVVLCLDGHSSLADHGVELLCGGPDRDLPRLWWKAQVATVSSEGTDFLRLRLELGTGPVSPQGPAQLWILSRTPLPPAAAEDVERPVDQEIAASLASFSDLLDWFEALGQRPDLARPWPSEQVSGTAPPPSAENERPPEPVAAVKPEVHLESRKKVEISGQKNASTQASTSSTQFLVREALVGGGFSQGRTGNLRISSSGLSFTPGGKSHEEWSIPWRDLREVSRDAGAWDVSYPLVIVDQQGRKRYIARVDPKGSYLPGDAILAAVRQRRAAQAGESSEESPGRP